MADKLNPPPGLDSDRFVDWLFKLRKAVNDLQESASAPAATSNLSAAQKAELTNRGDSGLHYHSSDRNRANHTGTQTSDTISDLDSFVQARITSAGSSSSSTSSASLLRSMLLMGA